MRKRKPYQKPLAILVPRSVLAEVLKRVK